ncbi:MAG: DUF512 domain-containing protein [Lachnospiraceae bacterium]|nr:DUF512 domain-containing protein [Lachnospiraceae bacterium]
MKKHIIKDIKPDSIAQELEIEPGDKLLAVNDEELTDIFDYQFMTEDEYLTILIEKQDGEQWELEIEKDMDEDIGLVFEQGLMDDYRSCCNKCIFCFIDQMPPGMRETLYFKDDDSRLSFLQGNYITLTNMKDADIDRIIRFNLAPINISIHTMNPELRCKMLNNRFAGQALKKIDRLYEAGVPMNGQIVLCKGVNDGDELDFSIREMMKYLPVLESVSVVPVGLTKYRENLYPLESFEKEDAEKVIDMIEHYQKEAFSQYGTHFIHASDEWYLLAGREMPPAESYDGYIQLENGVGMIRLMDTEFREALESAVPSGLKRRVTCVTGRLAYPFISSLADRIRTKFPNVDVNVAGIRNDFFGEKITVAGLLTGQDIYAQLKDRDLGEVLILPTVVLRSGEKVFLDDMTVDELSEKLSVPIAVTDCSGASFLNTVLGIRVRED